MKGRKFFRVILTAVLAMAFLLPQLPVTVRARNVNEEEVVKGKAVGLLRTDNRYSCREMRVTRGDEEVYMVAVLLKNGDFVLTGVNSLDGLQEGKTGTFSDVADNEFTGTVYFLHQGGLYVEEENRLKVKGIYTTGVYDLNGARISFREYTNATAAFVGLCNCTVNSLFENDCRLETVYVEIGQITETSSMFRGCTSLKTAETYIDMEGVTSMWAMFAECYSLEEIVREEYDTSAVTNMNWMFSNCHSLKELDISDFDTAAEPDIFGMFNHTNSLREVTLGNKWGKGWDNYSSLGNGYWQNGELVKTAKQLASGYWKNRNDWAGTWTRILAVDSVEMSASGLTLSWTEVPGASKYNIYLEGEKLTTIKNRSYSFTDLVMGWEYNIKITTKVDDIAYPLEVYVIFNPFEDVPMNSPGFSHISWAYNEGIVNGTSSTTFSPEGNCTRTQFCIMLYKMAGKPSVDGLTCPFTDLDGITGNNLKGIIWCYNQGIINGTSETTFSPKGKITRAQLAIMIWKMAGKPNVTGMSCPFTDLDGLSSNNKKAVIWCYNNYMFERILGSKFRPKTKGTRALLVDMLYNYNDYLEE
ncbi:MAG: S-layer homology domain-containing protein [Erysipelotrichaceae bacterium]|nr:S-layer homology domain-containing protein [Erysipelotrichaceae bacterium]